MKKINFTLFALLLLLTSCNYKLTSKSYIAIEPWKEWEIEIQLNKDSTFRVEDKFGCNLFYYSGFWHYNKDYPVNFLILTDTTKAKYILSHDAYQFYNKKTQKLQIVRDDKYFPVITTDTALIFGNGKNIEFRGLTFKKQKLFGSRDLEKKRVKLIEAYYINNMGKELYIKAIGNGKGVKEARKNIRECKITPITNTGIK
jgi:hypothetical protein